VTEAFLLGMGPRAMGARALFVTPGVVISRVSGLDSSGPGLLQEERNP
jgi:hypothetical protein